jgi:hypothetical protein
VVGSLCGYFFYIIVAFSAITALLIELSNEPTVQNVLHYPRPIFDQAQIVPDSGAWQVPSELKKKRRPRRIEKMWRLPRIHPRRIKETAALPLLRWWMPQGAA